MSCEFCIFNNALDNKSVCINCRDNPLVQKILQALPKNSYFQTYQPACPRGYGDCIYDPAYIKCYDPEWYENLYGSLTPEEAIMTEAECCRNYKDNIENMYCEMYDNEDK